MSNLSLFSADENIDLLVNKFPSVIAKYSSLLTPNIEKKVVWSRSKMLESFSFNQITFKDNQIFVGNKAIEFLAPEKSGVD